MIVRPATPDDLSVLLDCVCLIRKSPEMDVVSAR
ncbi:hypothetical protein BSF44_05190 [Pseudomonas sp. ACN8]|uniref:Uncharacterized protein n=1 Tax=Pseudomonas fluorescens TaxID=294 RepID=A0A5E7T9U4_PSEFL|nr:hypothetical protein BSF44_05190 [Pseudomonas sp. ACN8]VVP94990.1 hypothetical protein PS938_01942 [Pseudomonas fluorescens]